MTDGRNAVPDDNIINFPKQQREPSIDQVLEQAHLSNEAEIAALVQLVARDFQPSMISLLRRCATLRHLVALGAPRVIVNNQMQMVADAYSRLGVAVTAELERVPDAGD